ncbi:MAG: hypothetical protein WC822_01590 [Candidatus Paceibacterota bacterium]|jgi:hypothetical protein
MNENLFVVTPSRGRPGPCRAMVESIKATSTVKVGIIVALDDDDPRLTEYNCNDMRPLILPRTNTVGATNAAAALALTMGATIVVAVGDDMIFKKPGWDVALINAIATYPDRIVFATELSDMTVNDGTIIALTKEVIIIMGHYFWPNYEHYHADTWLQDIAGKTGRRVYAVEGTFQHNHQQFDETHKFRIRDNHTHIVADEQRAAREDAAKNEIIAKLIQYTKYYATAPKTVPFVAGPPEYINKS